MFKNGIDTEIIAPDLRLGDSYEEEEKENPNFNLITQIYVIYTFVSKLSLNFYRFSSPKIIL